MPVNDIMMQILRSLSMNDSFGNAGDIAQDFSRMALKRGLRTMVGDPLTEIQNMGLYGPSVSAPIQTADLSGMEKSKEEEKKAAEVAAASKRLMDEARASDEFIRSVDYEPSAEFSDPSKGIIVGDISAEKLKKIRDQAAAKFPGATGGNFVSAEMTPEVAARLAENEKWLQGQELRDAASRLNNRRVDPVAAAQGLAQIAAQQRLQQEQQNKDALVAALAGTSGKIPWDKAMEYQANNIPIPSMMIGTSRDEALMESEALLKQAQKEIGDSVSQISWSDPALKVSGEFAKLAIPLIAQYSREARTGDPEAAKQKFWNQYFDLREKFLMENPEAKYAVQVPIPADEAPIKQIQRGVNK